MSSSKGHVFYGPLIHTPGACGVLEILPKATIIVNNVGHIVAVKKDYIEPDSSKDFIKHELRPGQILIPGFIDTHIHAPQIQFTGIATDVPLMQWLTQHAFPAEQRLNDLKYAEKVYTGLVKQLLSFGTTTGVYFASTHLEATKTLAAVCAKARQRAFIGRVAMDREGPAEYIDGSADEAVKSTEEFISHVLSTYHDLHLKLEHFVASNTAGDDEVGGSSASVIAIDDDKSDLMSMSMSMSVAIRKKPGQGDQPSPLIYPVITPRFIPSCSLELLYALGVLHHKYNISCPGRVYIQSHISESTDEVELSRSYNPDFPDDTEVFKACGLLTPYSIMAHGVHLSDSNVQTLAEVGTAIAHCPLSNFYFADGVLDVKRAMVHHSGIKIGLGTDIAGGYSPSMLTSMRQAVIASKTAQLLRKQGAEEVASLRYVSDAVSQAHLEPSVNTMTLNDAGILSYKEAFWLATMGGAKAVHMQDRLGSFAIGKIFDALVIQFPSSSDLVSGTPTELLEAGFQQFIHQGDDRNIQEVWVQGVKVL